MTTWLVCLFCNGDVVVQLSSVQLSSVQFIAIALVKKLQIKIKMILRMKRVSESRKSKYSRMHGAV
jgi:hypothetical protein